MLYTISEYVYYWKFQQPGRGAAGWQNEKMEDKINFYCNLAQNYDIDSKDNKFYFFNPFSLEILQKVLSKILDSYYKSPRSILLFFYYPSDEYICYLMTVEELMFFDEIECKDLFPGNNSREKIVIFKLQAD